MHLRTKSLKYISSVFALIIGVVAVAQEQKSNKATLAQKIKIDGVAGVVGDFVILESDIERTQLEIRNQSQNTVNPNTCEVIGRLLDEKLFTHHAIQDSIIVPDGQINSFVDQQIERFTGVLGSPKKVVAYYKKESMAELRAELFEINKNVELARKMNQAIVEELEVTPEEIRTFYNNIPEDELPTFGVEVEIAQLIIEPKAGEEQRQEVIDKLNQYRADIIDNGKSFATKAVLYTQDAASRPDGGFMSIDKKTPLVKPFRDVVFSLQEGEVSEPFETEYGFHIATVDRIRGDSRDIRHILLIPEVTKKAEEEARAEIELIKKRIEDKELTFAEAAREFSDEDETKFNDGVLINPFTQDSKLELNKLDPTDYARVSTLEEGEVSYVFNDPSRTGKTRFKIMTVNKKYDEHKADYAKDYVKIKDLALKEKQIKTIKDWQDQKIKDTYVKINQAHESCDEVKKWFKN